MHGDLGVIQLPQRIVGGQRFGRGDIEQRPADPPFGQRSGQRGLIDHRTACDIDQHRIRLHRRQFGRADHAFGFGSGGDRNDDPVKFAQPGAPFVWPERIGPGTAADLADLHFEPGQPLFHFLPDRPITQDQRLRARQFALTGRVRQPFMPVLRANHRAVALALRQHQHDDIFGNRHRVDSGPIGQQHPARFEQIEWERFDPGIDRIEPFQFDGTLENLGHVRLRMHIEPADFSQRGERHRLSLGGIPAGIDPAWQVRFEQRLEQGIEDGYGHSVFLKLSSIGGRWRHSAKLNGRVVSGATWAA